MATYLPLLAQGSYQVYNIKKHPIENAFVHKGVIIAQK